MEIVKAILMVQVEVVAADGRDPASIAPAIVKDAEFIGEAVSERISEQSLYVGGLSDPTVKAQVFGSIYVEHPEGEWGALEVPVAVPAK